MLNEKKYQVKTHAKGEKIMQDGLIGNIAKGILMY